MLFMSCFSFVGCLVFSDVLAWEESCPGVKGSYRHDCYWNPNYSWLDRKVAVAVADSLHWNYLCVCATGNVQIYTAD